jgi:GNAT superfamily N-acetyltransferase
MTPRPTVVRATGAHGALLAELFERSGCACHCRYFHFEGDKHGWQARLASGEHENRSELLARLSTGSPEALGVVALERGRALGWLKLAPADLMQRQYQQRLFRGLPCFDRDPEGVFTLGCFLVDPGARRKGVARALLHGAIGLSRELGARAIEAFPNRKPEARDEELWQGPYSLLSAAGFQMISDTGTPNTPYPVMRLALR